MQRLLRTIASLQENREEQARLSQEDEAEEYHQEALRLVAEHEEELQRQLEEMKTATDCPDQVIIPPHFRELVVNPFYGTQDPSIHLLAFQTQVYISGRDDAISCKLFLGTLRGVAMQWFTSLPPRTIHTFNDLAVVCVLQFITNRTKRLEVVDLFDIQ
ncbi:hypothetical protein CR513_42907, partial [Mucuna pruriens]